jgi:lysozyme
MILSTLLGRKLPFWSSLSSVRQDVLVNIAYNIGITGLIRWPITLAAIGRGDYKAAADDIRNNKVWESEVKERDERCADALESNTW